jgi:hypothetical protein
MSIKHIIDSELRKLNLDIIIEGLNEIISNGNFTTALSETDKVQGLKEDGDVVVNIVNDELNADNCTLEENEVLSENVYKVYHGTNQKFSKFNFKNATQGIVWFTDSPESIEKGEHGGMGNNIIMTRYITINKPAGWTEYEKYGIGQLQSMGYDGVILPQGNKTDYFVFSPKSISAKDSSENNINESEILSEGLSDILYHFTYTTNLINILKHNKFATSSNLGSNADQWKDKGRFYFFSTQRTKGMSGYGRHHGNVAIVLDGRKLNYTFKGSPSDYWNWSTKRSDYKSIGDYTQALQSEENEDRIVTNKPYIDNANQYIIEIHIFIIPEHNDKETINQIVTLCNGYSIPIYFYLDENNFKLQNKSKTVDPNSLDIIDKKEKSEYDVSAADRDVYNAKWFFKKIAPAIIAGNDINDGYNDERDAIEKLLKQLLDKGNQSDQFNNIMPEILEKASKMGTSWGHFYADDEYRSMQAEIHNNRGNPNPYLRELLKMLVADMKKWRVNNLKEYFNKKFQAGIK